MIALTFSGGGAERVSGVLMASRGDRDDQRGVTVFGEDGVLSLFKGDMLE